MIIVQYYMGEVKKGVRSEGFVGIIIGLHSFQYTYVILLSELGVMS